MSGLIDAGAQALTAQAPVFTRRNLFHACRRASGVAITETKFEAALRRRLANRPLRGLLSEGRPASRSTRRSAAPLDSFPHAVLLVDHHRVLELFAALGTRDATHHLAVVCIDGTPAPLVDSLTRGFSAGQRAPVLYVHDASTVVYPFTLEPLATALRKGASGPSAYADLGLPPLGATPRRFADPVLPGDELLFELEAIPPATLLHYCKTAARRLAAAG